jgi:hypothetical protein
MRGKRREEERKKNLHLRCLLSRNVKRMPPDKRRPTVAGSGADEAIVVIVALSRVNDPPNGSPVMVTLEIPSAELT